MYVCISLGWDPLCMDCCCDVPWHGDDLSVALMRYYGSPGGPDSGPEIFCDVGSGVSHLGQVTLLSNQAQGYRGPLTRYRYFWRCGQVPSPAGE